MNSLNFKHVRTNEKDYSFSEKLLVTAFPENEHRELDAQRNNVDNDPRFFNTIIYEGENPIGFITYWQFDGFYYIEHFATSPQVRNGGYGKKILEHLHQSLNAPIILEVEMPEDEMSRRRIGFYERLGYTLLDIPYFQPPYRKEDSILPMRLMVYDPTKTIEDIKPIRENIYQHVYHYKV